MDYERFNRIKCDAKFRRIPKKSQKVKIDKRFQSMFEDKKFEESYKVDERGRPNERSSTKDLKRYYHLSSSDGSSSEDEEEIQIEDKGAKGDLVKPHSVDNNVPNDVKKKLKNLKVDYARGEQTLLSSSSDDEESEGDYEEEDTIEHKWGEYDADAETTDVITKRLAVQNMDWDRMRAVDIMVLLNSFLPPGGIIESVCIYVSEFGKERLAKEDMFGPPELTEAKSYDNDEETEEGSKCNMEILRQYQLKRLQYYYAVVTFNNENVANKIYTECDGMEYESSAVKLDLRFISDDIKFDDEPTDTCKEMPTKYQPKYFTTSALQQAKVNLTWDETNPDRINLNEKINSGNLDELDDDQLKHFIASSEDESDDEDHRGGVEKYSALLKELENEEKHKEDEDVELEATWEIGAEDKSKEVDEKKDKNPFEKYLEKRKEKRKQKRNLKKQENTNDLEDSDIPSDIDMNDPYFAEEFNKPEFSKKKDKKQKFKTSESDEENVNEREAELELLLEDTDDKKHFSLKKIQEKEDKTKKSKKNKRKIKKKHGESEAMEIDGFKVDVNDDRFSAVFSNHLYSIDPSNPHYKKTEGMETLIKEKLKRSAETYDEVVTKKTKTDNSRKMKAELGVLVKNLKRKTKEIMKNK